MKLLQSLLNKKEALMTAAAPPMVDRDVMARAYARLFATDDGRLVMAHLQGQTFLRTLSPDTPDSHIRFIEGQRALVHTILRFVAIGKAH